MSRFARYWYQSMIETDTNYVHVRKMNIATKLVITALLSTFATMFQSAGGFMPGIGFLISFLATLPIFVTTCFSIRQGILSYTLTIFLLFIIQPSELIIFPFTTGLLGIAIGVAFSQLQRRIMVVSFSSICLLTGIMVILYLFRFPVLGPTVDTTMDPKVIAIIYILSFLYCWILAELCRILMNRLCQALP
ncbi:hypothetical protein [Bacillus pseudomycoides]|uniref:Uncharacterized protein n=1 Tax=Bacillus pseudomycoides TaxID=64104 RepID=A0A2B5H7A6_9BACI|nr:hypothetical protein [Bacillus pseudomycoides]PDY44001.1 hypothetical protein CON79_28055 [Bacillus pseudomycoides]PEA84481.1 hypothetical protein CON99_06035 [Bacillus pseudomycoides]PED06456.1 hypothetical protein COO19_21120 [Bacillus pseudomycoides]PED72490.1 hypothetical protein CON97_08420 [Bacillus pseudomycoides]PEI41895.1 hypothetical protein CN620_11150 [Bacillus pseudomycoides]